MNIVRKYICGVSWQHELGECLINVYDSLELLKEKSKCWEQCGVVEIEFVGPTYPETREEVVAHKWVVDQNMRWGRND